MGPHLAALSCAASPLGMPDQDEQTPPAAAPAAPADATVTKTGVAITPPPAAPPMHQVRVGGSSAPRVTQAGPTRVRRAGAGTPDETHEPEPE